MKKRISIYIDVDVWENLKEHAWKSRKSASAYLEGLIRGDIPFTNKAELGELVDIIEDVKVTTRKEVAKEIDLEAENAKLLAKREKIAKMKNTGYFNPQPKGKK